MTTRTRWTSLAAVGLCALMLAGPLTAQSLPVAPAPEAVGLSSERLERLTRVMKDAVDTQQVAGTVTLVLRNGQVAYLRAEGAADREQGTPMRPDSIFRIASMT